MCSFGTIFFSNAIKGLHKLREIEKERLRHGLCDDF